MLTSPFFFTFTAGRPRMAAAVASPCGWVGAFAFLIIFFFALTTQTTRFCQTAALRCLIGNRFGPFEGVRM